MLSPFLVKIYVLDCFACGPSPVQGMTMTDETPEKSEFLGLRTCVYSRYADAISPFRALEYRIRSSIRSLMRESLHDAKHRPLDQLTARSVSQVAQPRLNMSLCQCLA